MDQYRNYKQRINKTRTNKTQQWLICISVALTEFNLTGTAKQDIFTLYISMYVVTCMKINQTF